MLFNDLLNEIQINLKYKPKLNKNGFEVLQNHVRKAQILA